MPHTMRVLFTTPVSTPQHWGIIVLVAVAFIFAPQFDYNDWERNTDGLRDGLAIYDNENAVYPPWGLVLLWPYYFLTSPGSRVASVLVVGWLASRCRWSLDRFFTIVLSPFFIWTMLLSNIDLLALLLPLILWEAACDARSPRRRLVWRGVALAILLIKPQGSFLLLLYWILAYRTRWRELALPVGLVALVVISTSLIGDPPLLAQWLDNVRNPSEENQTFWEINNVSLTDAVGPVLATMIVGTTLVCLYGLIQKRRGGWTLNHTYAALLLGAMLLSPYTSNQSLIVPFGLVPSFPAAFLQYVVIFAGSALKVYRDFDPAWTLLFGLMSLWFYQLPRDVRGAGDSGDLVTTSVPLKRH